MSTYVELVQSSVNGFSHGIKGSSFIKWYVLSATEFWGQQTNFICNAVLIKRFYKWIWYCETIFTCSTSVENKFVLACVLKTVKLFQYHSLRTSVLVYDGDSSNTATIKFTHSCHGAYSLNKSKTDKYEVESECSTHLMIPTNFFVWFVHQAMIYI